MNIFVGNLSFEAKEIDVQRAFAAFGVVTSVAIVMEKKGKKSRGFGFVEMPDEQEALAAIDQLQGKEILGRPINVMPAVSKGPKKNPGDGSTFDYRRNRSGGLNLRYGLGRKIEPSPDFKRTGKYKEGRRSLSYVKKRTDAGITTPVPESRYKSNPMRWLKKPRTPARFAKPEGELKPWQRPQTESKPWKKPIIKSGSWKKPEGELKPWQRPQGVSKPWEKSQGGSRPWIKTESRETKPWKKAESAVSRPWKKSASAAKPWRKSSADRQQSGKKPSRFSKP
ncbi:MAG: RNA-binding protein [Candidatus Omnitrophica bacterium]|nr:RNA-binding protein [Candidatus Omnitrophota bacterium]